MAFMVVDLVNTHLGPFMDRECHESRGAGSFMHKLFKVNFQAAFVRCPRSLDIFFYCLFTFPSAILFLIIVANALLRF